MLRWMFVLAAAVIAWPVAEISSLLDDQASVGHPSDWLACALFALSALLLIARWFQSGDSKRFPVLAVVLMAVASAICVQIDRPATRTYFRSPVR